MDKEIKAKIEKELEETKGGWENYLAKLEVVDYAPGENYTGVVIRCPSTQLAQLLQNRFASTFERQLGGVLGARVVVRFLGRNQ